MPEFSLTEKQSQVAQTLIGPETHHLIYGGSRCVSADTVLDGCDLPIGALAALGEPVRVLTSWGYQMAEPPFKKGRCRMVTVTLASGRSITVTPDHRFWNGETWIETRTISVGSVIATLPDLLVHIAPPLHVSDTPRLGGYDIFSNFVVSIEERTEEEDFYTLHVPGTEQYFANGFLNHNSGKTALICYAIQARAIKAPKSRHLIARHHFNHVKASVGRDTFPKILERAYPDVECRFDKVTSIFEFANSSEVWLAGLDDKDRVDKVLGTEFATIFVNEASQVSYHAVTTLRTRLAQNVKDVSGRMLPLRAYYDLNPTSRGHWTYKEFIEGVDPSSGKPMRVDEQGRALPPFDRTVSIMNPGDNPHLPAIYIEELRSMPLSKRMRFLEGRYLEEAPNSLWKVAQFDSCRMARPPDNLQRIAVGIDPSGARGADDDKADDIGIVVVGRDPDGVGYVLGDYTMKGSPEQWAKEAVRAFRKHQADVMVCERNYGGDMVRTVIQAVDKSIEPKMVTASRGKHVRAEPVAALYESCRVFHCGEGSQYANLESELVRFTPNGFSGTESPNRADALVWAFHELFFEAGEITPFATLQPMMGFGYSR